MNQHAIWDDRVSAKIYREYVESYPLDRALNHHLAEDLEVDVTWLYYVERRRG